MNIVFTISVVYLKLILFSELVKGFEILKFSLGLLIDFFSLYIIRTCVHLMYKNEQILSILYTYKQSCVRYGKIEGKI